MGAQVHHPQAETALQPSARSRSGFALMLLAAAAGALVVVIPFFFRGNVSGHDFEFHLASWMDVARQWREGVFYPHWAMLANWGFGEPRFIFYPPASWILGAALSLVFRWPMVPGVFIWLALVLASVSMFALAREWLPPRDAIVAGLLFALNPYHLVIVYWRSDFAELLASALVPLAVLFALRTGDDPRRAFVPLALVTASVWLCNAPAALIITYATALIVGVVAVHERKLRPLFFGGGALALGLALVSFYLMPAAFEQPWVNISEVLSEGLQFNENFLFTRTADAEHTRFNFIVSRIAVEVIIASVLAMIAAVQVRREQRRLWWALLLVTVVSIFLMLPLSSPLWIYVPKLRYVQFPWRWLLVLDVLFAFLLAAALARLRGALKAAACATLLVVLGVTGLLLMRNAWWDPGGVADFYKTHCQTGAGYFGADEYGPRGSDHYDLPQHPSLLSFRKPDDAAGEPRAQAHVQRWRPDRMLFGVQSSEAVIAAPRLLNYPAWRVEVNGKRVRAFSDPDTGQMLVLLAAGTNHVRIRWITTLDQFWGDMISFLAVVAMLIGVLATRRSSASAQLPSPAQPSR